MNREGKSQKCLTKCDFEIYVVSSVVWKFYRAMSLLNISHLRFDCSLFAANSFAATNICKSKHLNVMNNIELAVQ